MIAERKRDYRGIYHDYIEAVLAGRQVAGQRLIDTCQRQRDDEAAAPESGFYFCDESADHVCRTFELFKVTTGELAGEFFELRPWQVFILRTLFGWRRVDNDQRRFTEAFISIGRGNGKSPIAAGLAVYMLGFDYPEREPGAEVFCTATKSEQSRIVFNEAKRIVEQDKHLRSYIKRYQASLTIEDNYSTMRPLGSDSHSVDGLRPHLVVIDELHAWQDRHRGLREKLRTAMSKRLQSLTFVITTAGCETSDLYLEEVEIVQRVIDRADPLEVPELFAIVHDIDADDDPFDESCWPKANPMLEFGLVKIDGLRSIANRAKVSPELRLQFLRYHCNRFVTSSVRALTAADWAKGSEALPPPAELAELPAYVGMDWGTRDDLAAMAIVWPLRDHDESGALRLRYAVHCQTWIPGETDRRSLVAEPWAGWLERGWLRLTPGDTTDPDALFAQLVEWSEQYQIASLAADPHNARSFITKAHNDLGLPVFEFAQTPRRYHEPWRELIQALHEGRIMHGGQGLLAWAACNVVLKSDVSGCYSMPAKRLSREKIDPIVAVTMALSEAMYAERSQASFYETEQVEIE